MSETDSDRGPRWRATPALGYVRQALDWAEGKPAIAAGLRAAFVTALPLAVGDLLHLPLASWLSLGGLSGCLADRGGAYRTRAATYGAFALLGTLATVSGALLGRHLAIAVLAMFVWGFGANMLRVYRTELANVVGGATVLFAASMAGPVTAGPALHRAAYVVIGAVWAMAVALAAGPMRFYGPARRAVAACFRLLADRLDTIRQAARVGAPGPAWLAGIQRDHPRLREAIEVARATIAATRGGRESESARGERLVVLVESADQLFATASALTDVLEHAGRPVDEATLAALVAGAARLRGLAVALEGERDIVHALAAHAPAMQAAAPGAPSSWPDVRALLARLETFADAADEALAGWAQDRPSLAFAWLTPSLTTPWHREGWAPLQANLTMESIALRHALRVGIVGAVAVALAGVLKLPFGYWVTMTVVIILQPYAAASTVRGLQRVLGTVVGGILAAGIATVVHGAWAVLAIVFLGSGLAVALYPLNYAAYAVFVTATFVLLAELKAGSWHLSSIRVLDTLIGAALAMAGTLLLWPSRETERAPSALAGAIRALRDYAASVLRSGVSGSGAPFFAARRRVSLALANADVSLQRLAAEQQGRASVEAALAVLAYSRRLASSVTALALLGDALAAEDWRTRVGARVTVVLEEAARALEGERGAPVEEAPPVPLPDDASPALRAALQRVERQLGVLREAVGRATA